MIKNNLYKLKVQFINSYATKNSKISHFDENYALDNGFNDNL